MLEIPVTDWKHDADAGEAAALAQAPAFAPKLAARAWRVLPGIVRHGFTHFELETTVLAARVGERRDGAHGRHLVAARQARFRRPADGDVEGRQAYGGAGLTLALTRCVRPRSVRHGRQIGRRHRGPPTNRPPTNRCSWPASRSYGQRRTDSKQNRSSPPTWSGPIGRWRALGRLHLSYGPRIKSGVTAFMQASFVLGMSMTAFMPASFVLACR